MAELTTKAGPTGGRKGVSTRSISDIPDDVITARLATRGLGTLSQIEEERRRRRIAQVQQNKPGLAATILTSGLGIDDDDNLSRPTLLGA